MDDKVTLTFVLERYEARLFLVLHELLRSKDDEPEDSEYYEGLVDLILEHAPEVCSYITEVLHRQPLWITESLARIEEERTARIDAHIAALDKQR